MASREETLLFLIDLQIKGAQALRDLKTMDKDFDRLDRHMQTLNQETILSEANDGLAHRDQLVRNIEALARNTKTTRIQRIKSRQMAVIEALQDRLLTDQYVCDEGKKDVADAISFAIGGLHSLSELVD